MFEKLFANYFLGNRIIDYLIAVGIFFAAAIIVKIFECVILIHLKKLAEKTTTSLDDFIITLIKSIALPLAYLCSLYLSINYLVLSPQVKKITGIYLTAVVTLFTARFITMVISYAFEVYKRKRGQDIALERSLNGILKIIKLIVWGLAVVFFLDNLGFKISAVIAGLGIGGIAVALAAQSVLGDLFSYFSILFDRPFEIGDFIITGDYMGTVEHFGIKTTRIRSLGGEQIVFSNTDLTNSRVRNYKRMDKRRVVFKLGVTYQTRLEQLKIIPGLIEKIIKGIEDTVFDRAHFFSYGDFSLIFEVVYYVLSSDYNKYMDIHQDINFALKKEFEAREIEFAYPTQTIFVDKGG
ncbi:MAG: mechanosensitive ion channel family protein [Candidatus Omnitrophota bacterium]